MAAIFCQAVGKFHERVWQLLTGEKKRENDRKICTWSYVAKKIFALLQDYPTGLTEAVIVSELLTGLTTYKYGGGLRHQVQNLNDCRSERRILISEILETKQVDLASYLECYINVDSKYPTEKTRIVTLVDSKYVIERNSINESIPAVEMYLHQKASCMENVFYKYPVRMTNLRIHKVDKHNIYRLLPTEYFIPVLDPSNDIDYARNKFGTLEGIFEEDSFPHYTKNVFVTVKEMRPTETIHNQYGDSIRKAIIGVTDSTGIAINLVLWDEAIAFKRLFSVGDSLGIEDPFFVKEGGKAHLEYGPATTLYCMPAVVSTETVPSQLTSMACVRKTAEGNLDYKMYPFQFLSTDVMENSVNVTFVGTVSRVSKNVLFHCDGMKEHQFLIQVSDTHGSLDIKVYDNQMVLHEKLYKGQMVLVDNMETDDQSSCILRTVHGGRISIISALKGYVASPCFYTLTSRVCDEDDGNYFILGRIVSIQPKEDAFTKRVHLTCLCKLTTNKEGQLGCHSCEMYDLLEKSHKSYNSTKSLSNFWTWKYDMKVCITVHDVDQSYDLGATEQVCEQLMELSVEKFGEKDVNLATGSSLNCWAGKQCVFSVTKIGYTLQMDAFEVASESFLRNFMVT